MVFCGHVCSSLLMFDHGHALCIWSCMVHMAMYYHGKVLSYTMNGKVWSFMVMYGHVRPCMILFGHVEKMENKG